MPEISEISEMSETKKGGLGSNALKLIAIALMLIDHTAVVFSMEIYNGVPYGGAVLHWMRMLARVAFPLFAFYIAVGARYTSNILKYLGRLGAFALISEIPFDLAFNGKWLEFTYQNVFFTLFLGLFCIFCYQKLKGVLYGLPALPITLAVMWLAECVLQTDYGAMGVLVIVLFYFARMAPRPAQIFLLPAICLLLTVYPHFNGLVPAGASFNRAELFAVAAAPLMLLYNGKKGIHINRWFFYAFYPGHLLLLALLHGFLFGFAF